MAFVPLLQVAEHTTKRIGFFGYAFLAMLTWNAATTWWIWNSTDVGSIAAIIANSLLMCLPWWGYHIFKNKYGKRIGYFSLVTFWMLFEYVHLNWQLSWPWLTLGNVFATHPDWVQWYEYTGVSGGTVWVLIINILLFEIMLNRKSATKKNQVQSIVSAMLALIVPLFFSVLLNPQKTVNRPVNNVIIVQPDIDPYQKFENLSVSRQIQQLITLSENKIDSFTQLVIWPETALSEGVVQNELQKSLLYKPVFDFVNRHPGITLLTGIESYKIYGTDKATATARKMDNGMYYDAFNSAVVIKADQPLQFYNKSKLVPGVESLPAFLNFMAPVFEKFGGTTGGYGRDTGSVAFHVAGNPYITAPIICYESIYGEYVAGYVKKGANLLTIITNDGWWGNTPGHKQHLQYARLRAIETRRFVARSANTGTSAVIDDAGNILTTQPWDTSAIIKYSIPTVSIATFYVKYGDYLFKIATVLALLLIGWNWVLFIRNKFTKRVVNNS